MADPALEDRRRAEQLLRLGTDPLLSPAEPDPIALAQDAEWVMGFADSSGIRISVLFIRDPDAREQVSHALRAAEVSGQIRVGVNGALVFFGCAPEGADKNVLSRLRLLGSRFAGHE